MDQPYILAPQHVKIGFDVHPVYNGLHSIREVNDVEQLSGLGEWVSRTAAQLSPDELTTNVLVFDAFYPLIYTSEFIRHDQPSLVAFIEDIAALDPVYLRDQSVRVLIDLRHKYPHHWVGVPSFTAEMMLSDHALFNQAMGKIMDCEEPASDAHVQQAYRWYNEPEMAQTAIVAHLRMMWEAHLKTEWERVLPMLEESVTAYRQVGFADMSVVDAIRAVTGRDLTGKLEAKDENVSHVRFIPNAHIGPYIGRLPDKDVLWLIFGARLPRESRITSPALSRSELLVRLNALADDVRLRILELLTKHEEMCAQDIIEQLGLSQSSVSRHLSQLSATGYLIERRRDVNKCYSLNPERINDTARALTQFLSRG
ncbi:MAG: metalloregulator ArsR/SmtB family transcription factor [Anaerolineae bacterium]